MRSVIRSFIASLTLMSTAAYAQQAPADAVALPPAPPAEAVPLPSIAAPAAAPQQAPAFVRKVNFPALPPSRACTKEDIVGGWKLLQVYEEPEGTETNSFKVKPYQYLWFVPNDIYKKHSVPAANETVSVIKRQMLAYKSANLEQFVVNESGIVFFYRNGIAIDSQACFIVTDPTNEFPAGRMLLMPPQGKITGRLIKVYERVWKRAPANGKRKIARRRGRKIRSRF